MLNNYKLIIFDFDGTLADTYPWFSQAINQLITKYRLQPIKQEDLEAMRCLPVRDLMRYLGVPRWKIPFMARCMRSWMARDIHSLHLFGGVKTLLRNLSESGTKLAVISSNSWDNIARLLGPEIAILLRHSQCGVPLFGKAPRLQKIMRKHGTAAEHTLFVGDEVRDAEAAAKAKISFGAVSWGYNSLDSFRKPVPRHIFTSISHLHGFLLPSAPSVPTRMDRSAEPVPS